jgi:hypothetical protein
MNEDDLYKAFDEELKDEPGPKPAITVPDLAEIQEHLLKTARELQTAYRESTNAPERGDIEKKYRQIDKWLGEIRQVEGADEDTRRTTAQRIYVAMDDARLSWKTVDERRDLSRAIERGRKEILEKAKAGAGENTFQRIRHELNYLLNNYQPSNEPRIEALIDQWRRSGDPAYDPAVRGRLRAARKKKAASEHPI